MGGNAVIPTVPCDGLLHKIREENYQLENFAGMLKHVTEWGEFRLSHDQVIEDLQEQKKKIDKILKQIKAVSI